MKARIKAKRKQLELKIRKNKSELLIYGRIQSRHLGICVRCYGFHRLTRHHLFCGNLSKNRSSYMVMLCRKCHEELHKWTDQEQLDWEKDRIGEALRNMKLYK